MTETLVLLFYFTVFAFVVGCFVYLRRHRGEGGGDGSKLPARWTTPWTPERGNRKTSMILLLLLYVLVFKAAVGSLCGLPGSGWVGERRMACEILYGLGLGKWRDTWTSLDSLLLLLALGGTVVYWKKFATRKPEEN